MKRMRMWLREMTLIQQLAAIIVLFVALLTMFVLVFLGPAIDKFSEAEMYRILHSTQSEFVKSYEEYGFKPIGNSQTVVINAIYSMETDEIKNVSGPELSEPLKNHIKENARILMSGSYDYKYPDKDNVAAKETFLYTITRMEDGNHMVSVMADDYRMEFRNSLTNGLVWMNILFVTGLFVIMLLWVTTLIFPLSQIKAYITKLKNDDEKAVLNVDRRDEIGEVANALSEMAERLAQENREKQEMIQNISHDLKTPIATIKSYGESIKDGIYPYDTLEKSVDVIIEHADRLEKKVKSLIILNKMGYLLDDCPPGETLSMNKVIDKAILSLKVVRPEVRFIVESDEEVFFHGDEEPWRITVENLIDNALRYAKSYIKITLKPGELCVINDGVLIPDDFRKKLFSPYEKGSGGQFGLGLSIVYRVVLTYGYRVEAENLTEGVCFRIWREIGRNRQKKKTRHASSDAGGD